MHGGAAGSGGQTGIRNSNYRHGGFTCEAVEKRKRIRMVLQNARESLSAL
jgi:hypothetical protein